MKTWVILLLLLLVFRVGAITGEVITGKATEGKANASVTVYDVANFTIVSPENTSYNFIDVDDVVLDLNVTWSGTVTPTDWTFTLVDLWLNVTINSSAPFTPNATIRPNRKSHNLTVYAENEIGFVTARSVIFYIQSNNSAPVIDIPENELFVCENEQLGYSFDVTDAEDGGITLDLEPTNPYFIYPEFFTGYSRTISLFSTVLDASYIGSHEINISATDGESSESKRLNVTVIETNSRPTVGAIPAATVWAFGENKNYYKQVSVYDTDCGCDQTSGNFTFNLTYRDGSTPFFNISQYGVMNFTANETLLGPENMSIVYNMTLCVSDQALESPHANISLCDQDGSSMSFCRNFTVTVTGQNRAPTIENYYPGSLVLNSAGTSAIYFNATTDDLDGTLPDAYWYVDGVIAEHDVNSNFDEFTHTFGCGVSGMHMVSLEVTDGASSCYSGSCNASLQWIIIVSEVACPTGGDGDSGGGGGGGGTNCLEAWGCEEWTECGNAKDALDSGTLSGEDYREILGICVEQEWGDKICGYQTKNCIDANSCGTRAVRPEQIQVCYYIVNPNCADGIKNCHDGDCEFMVDCGGACEPCSSCSDGKQNQGEKGIDCEGPCPNVCESETPLLQPKGLNVTYFIVAFMLLAILGIKIFQMIQMSFAQTEEVQAVQTQQFSMA